MASRVVLSTLVLSTQLLLTACAGEPAPGACEDSVGGPIESGVLQIGRITDEGFLSYEADARVPFTFGLQGGSMITPVLALPADRFGDVGCFDVELENRPDPDAPEAFGEVDGFRTFSARGVRFEREGDLLRSPQLLNQLGRSRLDGTRLNVAATLHGEGASYTSDATIEVIGDTPQVCLDLPLEAGGCSYRIAMGQGEIVSMEPVVVSPGSGTVTCPDPLRVQLRFLPDDPAVAACWEDLGPSEVITQVRVGTGGYDPPTACTGDWTVGDLIPMSLAIIDTGTCSPLIPRFDLPDCDAACP